MIDTILQGGPWTYLLLALVAFGDALIGVGMFVVGEIAFLAAGVMLASTGNWSAVTLVLLSAWLGDLTSFMIGRRYGSAASRRLWGTARRRRLWRKARARLARHGTCFVVAARFMGPVAWFTPFLAGTLHMSLLSFAPASAVGVLLGAGQFIAFGAFGMQLTDWLPRIWEFLAAHWAAIAILLAMALAQIAIWRRSRLGPIERLLTGGAAAAAILLGTNLLYFFAPPPTLRAEAAAIPQSIGICDLPETELLAVPGSTNLHLPQPINVALLSSRTPEEAMRDLGWQQNRIFTRGAISPSEYIGLLRSGTPPVSELRFQGETAQSAFQLPGTLSQRTHIRWWAVGPEGEQTLYLGAISRDEEIAIKYYGPILALLHDIDPEVDRAREKLASQFAQHPGYIVEGRARLIEAHIGAPAADYVTDGDVLVLSDSESTISAELRKCLGLSQLHSQSG